MPILSTVLSLDSSSHGSDTRSEFMASEFHLSAIASDEGRFTRAGESTWVSPYTLSERSHSGLPLTSRSTLNPHY